MTNLLYVLFGFSFSLVIVGCCYPTKSTLWLWRPEIQLRIAFALVLLAYLRTIGYDYVYDDVYQVFLNPWIISWGGLRDIFTHHSWAFFPAEVPARYYRPVYLLWLWVIRMPSNGAPGWFHFAAILTHLGVSALAFLLAQDLLHERRGAAIAAMLFALHPTKIEAVAWISGASEVVHAAFFFGVFVAYFRWRENPRWYWLAISVASYAGAIFAKETAVLAPLLVLIYQWLAAEPNSRERSLRRLAALAAPYAAVDATYFLIRTRVLGGLGEVDGLSLVKTAYSVPLAFCWYLKQLVWPFRLSVIYPELIVQHPEMLRFFGCAALLLIFGTAYWVWAGQSAEMKFLGMWFVATLTPVVVAILLLQPHDRYLYLPSFAFAVVVAKVLTRMNPTRAVAAALALALVYTATICVEEQYWEDDQRIFTRAVDVAPESPRARDLLFRFYRAIGDQEMALNVWRDGYQRAPENEGMSYGLAVAYYDYAEYDRAAFFFRRAIQSGYDGQRIPGLSLYYLALIAQEQMHPAAAEALLRQAIQTTPKTLRFRVALANLLEGKRISAGLAE